MGDVVGSTWRAILLLTFVLPNAAAQDALPGTDPAQAAAPEAEVRPASWHRDGWSGLKLAGRGFVGQFRQKDSLAALLVGGAVTGGIAATVDDEWTEEARQTEWLTNGAFDAIGDNVVVAMAFTPIVTYVAARGTHDERLRAYSVETLGAFVLAWAETSALSQIPTHERPRDKEGQHSPGLVESGLRGDYSWPSGHLIAPTILTMKTADYYGWLPALLPASVAVISAAERVGDGHHTPSDITGAVALSLSAHFATRRIVRDEGFDLAVKPGRTGAVLLVCRRRF